MDYSNRADTEVKEEMRKILFAVIFILCAGMLSGCSSKADVDTSTVFIEKKGNIISVDVEHLDKDYYDTEELEEYITKHLEEYTQTNGDTIEQASFDIKDGIAKLKMEYDSCEDYTGFNGIELYTGNIVEAQAAGYDFDTDFYSVSDSDEKKKVSGDEVLKDDECKVAIIKANVDVQVPGTVLYISGEDTEMVGNDTVSIVSADANEEAHLTYIIYR